MGKQRIQDLLEELKANHQRDVENANAIYTVAQVAVNQLDEIAEASEPTLALPEHSSPILDREELKRRYHNYQGCRRAAKALGIRFSKTPSWEKLACAFSYAEALRQFSQHYLNTHPNPLLQGIKVDVKIPESSERTIKP